MYLELLYVLAFYILVFTFGVLGTLSLRTLFKYSLLDSYYLGRTVGLLLFGYLIWLSGTLGLIPFNMLVLWGLFLVCGIGVVALNLGNRALDTFSLRELLRIESVFLFSYLFMTIYLFVFPDISGGEKYMNFAIFNSLMRNNVLPPKDMWMSSYSLNYYYFGHLVYTIPAKMLSIRPEIAFNLILSVLFSTVFSMSYFFGKFLTSKTKYGLLTAYFICFAGNLFPTLAFILNPQSDVNVIKDSVRFVPDAINDIPSYSFFLGGLHSHVFDIPFVLLFLILLYKFYSSEKNLYRYFLVFSLLLGSMFVTNGWDFPIYLGLLGLLLLLKFEFKKAIITGIFVLLLSFGLFALYHLTVTSSAIYGIGYAGTPSGPILISAMFGIFFLLLLPWISLRILKVFKTGILSIQEGNRYILMCILWGLFLVYITEIIYVKDLLYIDYFASRRSNTVYKLWYQAWILFSIATPYVLHEVLSIKNRVYKPLLALVIFILSLTIPYPAFVLGATFFNKFYLAETFEPTLDGTKYLKSEHSDVYEGIQFLEGNSDNLVLLEPPGEQYGDLHSIFSTYTGHSTVIGWYNHERVWRGSPPEVWERLEDVEAMYSSHDKSLVGNLLVKYGVTHVLINAHARELYGEDAGALLMQMSALVFENGTVSIYRIEK